MRPADGAKVPRPRIPVSVPVLVITAYVTIFALVFAGVSWVG